MGALDDYAARDLALFKLRRFGVDRRVFIDQLEDCGDGRFELRVDARRTVVRTILARNWFAEYVVLDSEDNPLILRTTLNPLSGGALDVFSPLMDLKAVLGYQVLELRTGG